MSFLTKHLPQSFKEFLVTLVKIDRLVLPSGKFFLIGGFALSLLGTGLPFLSSFLQGEMINRLIKDVPLGAMSDKLIWIILASISIAFLRPTLGYLRGYLEMISSMRINLDLTMAILQKRGDLDIAQYEDPECNDLMQRAQDTGTNRVQHYIFRQQQIILALVDLAIASTIVARINPWITIMIILGVLPEMIVELKYGQQVWEINKKRSVDWRKYNAFSSHFFVLRSVLELKLYQNVKYFVQKAFKLRQTIQDDTVKVERRRTILSVLTSFISQITLVITTFYFLSLVFNHQIEIGTLTFLISSIGAFRVALGDLFMYFGRIQSDTLYMKDLLSLLELPQVLDHPAKPLSLGTQLPPIIEFDQVSFKYPKTNKYVLKDISFTINPGEKVALIGVNGAGKSTIIKLLCRFYDPSSGEIRINGVNLRELGINEWYQELGILFQEFPTYDLTVAENIALGNTKIKIDQNKIMRAAKSADADPFINQYKNKYNQQIGRRFVGGIDPSGGQCQKLALSRVLYRNASILILDEPTSAVDAESEAKIFERLEKEARNKSIILVSHRFSTVRNASRIVVIENGRILETGTHHELLENNLTYAHLFNLQAKGYVDS